MLWNIIEAVNVVLEFIIVYLFHTKLFKKKYETKSYYLAAYSIGAVVLYVGGLLTSNSSILITVTFILLFLISFFLYEGTNSKKIFCSSMFIVFIITSEMLFISMMTALKLGTPADIIEQGANRIIGMLGTKIIYFWMIYIVCNLINKKTDSIPVKHWIMIILMPCLSAVILCVLFQSMTSAGSIGNIIYVISVSGLLYINIAVFDFFETYQKKLRLSVLEQVIEIENTNYKLLEKSYSDMKALKHDIRNQIDVIKRLIEQDDKKSAETVLKNVCEKLNSAGAVCYTGEPIIDSILNIKLKTASEMGIKVVKCIKVTEFCLDRIELCRALGNALDDAVEGCQRSESDEQHIFISIQQIEDKIAIEISNSSNEVDLNNLQTSKRNKSAHGIGMDSIRSSVEILNGFMDYDYKNGVFFLKMVLDNKTTACAVSAT